MRRWIYETLLFLIVGLLLYSCVKDNPISSQAQFRIDTTSISDFIKNNQILAQKNPAGFWYWIDSLDTGILPVTTDSVKIQFTEELIPSLQEVDNADSLKVSMTNVNAGIQQGLQLFPAGSSGRLYVPSGLAFGSIPLNNIKINSNLFYKIKLLSVASTHLSGDILAIEAFLTANAIIAQVDSKSGIRYVLDTIGTKPWKPQLADSIHVIYNFRTLGATAAIKSADSVIALNSQIAGLKIILPKITQGSTVTIYIPSGYAYGGIASTTVPANSNLVYHLTLDSVIHH